MGQYRFLISSSDRFSDDSLTAAQIVGLDGVPWPCKATLDKDQLVILRNTDFSGRLLVSLRTSVGEVALLTGTLQEQPGPYCLLLELARGTLSRLRNQLSLWREGGLRVANEIDARLDETSTRFVSAIFLAGVQQRDSRSQLCLHVIDETLELMHEVSTSFGSQVKQIREEQEQAWSVRTGFSGPLPASQKSHPPIGLVEIQRSVAPITNLSDDNLEIDFSALDRAAEDLKHGATFQLIGPLIDFCQVQPAAWLNTESPFDRKVQIANAVCRKFAERYAGQFKTVHVAAGLNGVGHQQFNHPEQVQLTLEMMESLDSRMASSSILVSFDQPWGERLAMSTGATQGIEIADSLLRYGARISALGVDVCLDYFPHGSLIRDPFQWVDLIDRWSQFGLPLVISLCGFNGDLPESPSRFNKTIRSSLGHSELTEYLAVVLQILRSRPAVSVVNWRHISDDSNARFPGSGLFDGSGQPKPLAQWLGKFLEDADTASASV